MTAMSPRPPPPDEKALTRQVRVPHPRGASHDVRRADGARRFLSLSAAIATGATLTGAVAFGIFGLFAAAVVAVPAVLLVWGRSRTLTVRVDDRFVTLPDGSALPKGEGALIADSVEYRDAKGNVHYRWQLSHSHAGVFERQCTDPRVARACAEALAFAGGWPLLWRPHGDREERRAPDELDVPLAVREAREPSIPLARAAPVDPVYVDERVGEAGVRLRCTSLLLPSTPRHWLSVFLTGAAVVVGFGMSADPPLIVGLCALAVVGVMMLPLTTPELLVTTSGIELRYRMVGGITLRTRTLRSSEIESLYVETPLRATLVAAGDGFHKVIARGLDPAEGQWLRGVVVQALTGTPPPSAAGAADPLAPPAGTCPACARHGLERVGGELDEERCPACGGRFLSAHGTERLVEGELGITRDVLRALAGYFAGERRHCPSCRSRTSPVRLKGVMADLCQGCGGLWLDAGELSELSHGRYDG